MQKNKTLREQKSEWLRQVDEETHRLEAIKFELNRKKSNVRYEKAQIDKETEKIEKESARIQSKKARVENFSLSNDFCPDCWLISVFIGYSPILS
jgi:hypothetical protein